MRVAWAGSQVGVLRANLGSKGQGSKKGKPLPVPVPQQRTPLLLS